MTDWTDPESCPGGDPYLHWALQSDMAGFAAAAGRGADVVLPLLFELADGQSPQTLAASGLVAVPGAYLAAAAPAQRHCTGHVRRSDLPQAVALAKRAVMALPLKAGSVDAQPPPQRSGDPSKLVIGIIDRGCAFLNRTLRRAASGPDHGRTRIRAFWDQGHAAAGQPWLAPESFGYGRELDAAAIETLIARVDSGRSEAQVYRDFGHLADGSGRIAHRLHGTHVIDTAAGLAEERALRASAKPERNDAASLAELVFVGVPELAAEDTTGASGDAYVLDAIHYILGRAGAGTRVVINLSIGAQAGPHDGSSCIEQAIDHLLQQRTDLAVVVAAGNGRPVSTVRREGRWQLGGQLAAPSQQGAQFVWRTLANDVTDSFLEVWLGSKAQPAQAAQIQVTTPDGQASGWTSLGQRRHLQDAAGATVATLSCQPAGHSALGSGAVVHLALAPSTGQRPRSMAGRWLVQLRSESGTTLDFDAWVQRDEPPSGFDLVLQSSLEEADDSVRIGQGNTLSHLGAGEHTLVVGATRLADNSPAPYSSGAGPSPSLRAPRDADVLAPADESATAYGLWAAGVESGSLFRMSGTSVSAPVLTRVLANWLMRQPAGTPAIDLRRNFLAAVKALPLNDRPKGSGSAPRPLRCGIGTRL